MGNENNAMLLWNCCDRKSRVACAQSFALWQQATIAIMCRNLNIFVLRAHPVHDESHIQGNATVEVATTSPPFYNEPHRSHVLFAKATHGTTFYILVTAPFC